MTNEKKIASLTNVEFVEAVETDIFTPGCDVINSDVANSPAFIEGIEARLKNVGNHCFGDISAALDESNEVSEFSLSLIDAYFEQQPA